MTLEDSPRDARDRRIAKERLPSSTRKGRVGGRLNFVFIKQTQMGIPFEITLYYDPDEDGYLAQLISPEIERDWRNPHIGHIFEDGVICVGGAKGRASPDLLTAFSKSCVWAEGIAIMIASRNAGRPTEFPFSDNNHPGEVG